MPSIELIQVAQDIINFLDSYSWLFNFPVIQLFSTNIIDQLPKEWCLWYRESNFNINLLLPTEKENIDCSSLKNFIEQCNNFTLTTLLQSRCKSLSFESFVDRFTKKSPINSREQITNEDYNRTEINKESSLCPNEEIWKAIKQANPKKKHEVEELATFVNRIKQFTNSNNVLDIGSGLGYLDLYLHLKFGYKIIGAEGSFSNFDSSLKLEEKCLGSRCPNVNFLHWNLEDNATTMEKLQELNFDMAPCTCRAKKLCAFCINVEKRSEIQTDFLISTNELDYKEWKSFDLVSLHACADLTPLIIKMFRQHNRISSIVILSCCYHKMSPVIETSTADSFETVEDSSLGVEDSSEAEDMAGKFGGHTKFNNFPLSVRIYDMILMKNLQINTFGLRLASEESILHWKNRAMENLNEDIRNIAYRSILQDVCNTNFLKMKKLKRHSGKKSSYKSYSEYIKIILKEYQFITQSGEEFLNYSFLSSELEKRYLELEESIPYVGLIRGLQLSIQPVLETLILLDRVFDLKANGYGNCGITELFDELKSPRNKAIFAFK